MAALKFTRKLGETWIFDLTALDRTGARQSILGVADLAAKLEDLAGNVIWSDDNTGCSIVETAGVNVGDFQYKRSDLATVVRPGTYRLDFKATINGDPIEFPEDSYVIIEVI